MTIKEELRLLRPTISKQLPRGAITQISKEMGLNRHSITRMLEGQFGNEENLIQMLNIVAKLVEKEGSKQLKLSKQISLMVSDKANVTAG